MQTPSYVQIQDNPGLSRHIDSMTVVNTDTAAQLRYRNAKNRIVADKQALEAANQQIQSLRNDLSDLRELVNQCLLRKIN